MASCPGNELSVSEVVLRPRRSAHIARCRKGHYIVAEYADKVVNRVNPNYPWQVRYSFALD